MSPPELPAELADLDSALDALLDLEAAKAQQAQDLVPLTAALAAPGSHSVGTRTTIMPALRRWEWRQLRLLMTETALNDRLAALTEDRPC